MESANLSGIVGTQASWGHTLMAVTNDNNEVILIKIHSPTSTFGAEDTWFSEVLDVFSPSETPDAATKRAGTFDEAIWEQRYISHISWSPWVTTEAGAHSILAYATNEDIRARVISIGQSKNLSLHPEVVILTSNIRQAGPMKWTPTVSADGSFTLAVYTTTEVICMDLSPHDASVLSRSVFQRDQWDIVSGTTWDLNGDEPPRLHFSLHTTTTRAPEVGLELSAEGLNKVDKRSWPYWRDQIRGSEGHYSTTHELKGHARTRVWGLCTSPLRDFIATCHSIHPMDMIAYGSPHDRKTIVTISHLWGRGSLLMLPPDNVAAEGIFFTVLKWLEHNIESAGDMPSAKKMIRSKLTQAYRPIFPVEEPIESLLPPTASINFDAFNKIFKRSVFFHGTTVEDRFGILTSIICNVTDDVELSKVLIAFRLAMFIQAQQPPNLSQNDPLSKSIIRSSTQAVQFIEALFSEDTSTNPTTSQHTSTPHEKCHLCGSGINFDSLTSATCANGHFFRRCGLSFLVIRGPDQSKYCGICQTAYSDESQLIDKSVSRQWNKRVISGEQDISGEALSDGNGGEGQSTDHSLDSSTPEPHDYRHHHAPAHTLAQSLFLACDACIYCGGKFVG